MNLVAHPVTHRDGDYHFASAPEAWKPCSAWEDFALTFGTFALAMVAPVSFVVWVVS